MDKGTVSDIIQVIDKELTWCIANPDPAFTAEYRKGFTNGLIQAKYLIGEMAKAMDREPEHGDLSQF